MSPEPNVWITAALIAVAALIVWEVVRPKWPIRVVAGSDGVRWQKGIAAKKLNDLDRFIQHDLRPQGKVTIQAKREHGGILRVRCRGKIDPGQQQQIRNFLTTML